MWLFRTIKKDGLSAKIYFPETVEEGDSMLIAVHKKGERKPVANKKVTLIYPIHAREKKPKMIDKTVAYGEADVLLVSTCRKEKKKN